jgi:hypothetical protein
VCFFILIPGTCLCCSQVCVLQNFGTSACLTGSETGCICLLDNDCKSTGATYVMYMNTTKRWETWINVIEEAVMQTDKTCGGAPIYPAPNNFTTGLKCETDEDCDATNLETCTPGVDCFCCANMSHVCSVDLDCNDFDAQSSCGCTPTPQPAVRRLELTMLQLTPPCRFALTRLLARVWRFYDYFLTFVIARCQHRSVGSLHPARAGPTAETRGSQRIASLTSSSRPPTN